MADVEIKCTGSDSLPLDAIEDFQGNLKKRSKGDIESIITSIKRFGFSFPFFVWQHEGHNYCLDGHGRIDALVELRKRGEDLPMFPVSYVEADDEYEAKNKLLRLNSAYGEITFDGLEEFAEGFEVDWDELSLPGSERIEFHSGDDDEPVDTDPQVDRADELQAEWGTELGDIWQLGNHRLLCGDATDAESVERLLAGVKPHLMVTDPPYGVEYDAEWRSKAGVNKNKGKMGRVENDENADWSAAWDLFPGDVAYVWHAGTKASVVAESLEASRFKIRAQIIWVKDRFALSRGDYHWQHEPCWYCVRSKGHFNGDRKQTTVWNIATRDDSGLGHSTQKPLECMRRPIVNNSSPGQAVYEPFSGSGTTIIAAENEGRVCYAIELSPGYVAVALQRFLDTFGVMPTKTASK